MKSKIKKVMEKNKNEIILSLPGFINQLLLLMNSGAVLTEAFCKIAEGYGGLDERRQNYFTVQVYNLYAASLRSGENVIQSFYKFGRTSNVKELARVAGILMENQNRGTDLWDKLAEQSEMLWEERKRAAMRKICLSESKMSFPLGILLIALIVITAAPAMLQI